MDYIEIMKAIILGVVEGFTEWLPISSTGHMILVDEFLQLNMTSEFKEVFFVVIQLGAVLAVIVLYFKKLFPFTFKGGFSIQMDIMTMWFKIVVCCIPAIIGIIFDDLFTALFYNYISVAIMLIIFGVFFILIENFNKDRPSKINSIADITYETALIIGMFQLIAAIFPGTSRSGATIIGALLIGVSRIAATEFTFYLAIPAMIGASGLKIIKHGFGFTGFELIILLTGMVVAFLISIIAIKFLLGYIRKHDFKVFGWYRIILGVVVLLFFGIRNFIIS